MLRSLALLALAAALPACDRGEPRAAPAPPAVQLEAPAALSPQQIAQRAADCREHARKESGADRYASAGEAPEGLIAIGYAQHYNAKLDTCFLLRSASFPAFGGSALRRTLVDAGERERYGEYQGPADAGEPLQAFPETCKVAGLYCASQREWEVLVRSFMEG